MTTLTLRPGNALERRRALAGLLGVSPALLAIGLFLVVPILIVAAYSLMQANPYGGVNHVFSSDAYVSLLFERQLDEQGRGVGGGELAQRVAGRAATDRQRGHPERGAEEAGVEADRAGD